MLVPIVKDVTALAEGTQVPWVVVRRVVVEMGGRQHNEGS